MFGTWRFFLAALVALSHDGITTWGLNPGVAAVVGFYLISGYVMTGLLRRHFTGWRQIPAFYTDRILRLAPAYLAVCVLTVVWYYSIGHSTHFLQRSPDWVDWLNNLLVVPLNFYMYNDSDQFTLIPPAWSLGAEIQFYLLIPFILFLPRLFLLLFVASVGVQMLAGFGWLHSDWYGYRLLPGVLFIFLLGALLFDVHHHNAPGWWRYWVPVAVGVYAVVLFANGTLNDLYHREVLLGLVASFVAINLLGKIKRRPIDEYLGHLSYGVFLSHFLIMWLNLPRPEGLAGALVLVLYSTLLAAAIYGAIERPFLRLRHARRYRRRQV